MTTVRIRLIIEVQILRMFAVVQNFSFFLSNQVHRKFWKQNMQFFDITMSLIAFLRNFPLRKQFFVRKISKLLWLHQLNPSKTMALLQFLLSKEAHLL